jgi:hypothetical protein
MLRRGMLAGLLAVAACSPPSGERAATDDRASPDAAVRTVRDYYRLVEAGRMAEAAELREDGGVEDVAPFLSLKAEVAGARPAEGEPGWTYVRVPVALIGRFVTGGDYRAAGAVTLRRTDRADAPPPARRWRIHRIVVRAPPSGGLPTG